MPWRKPFEQPGQRIAPVIWFVVWAGITGVGVALQPDPHGHGTHQQLGLMPCPSVLAFNRPCPGCGLTTSWTRLLHGDLAGAFAAHALGPIAYLLFTVSAWLGLVGVLRGFRLDSDSPHFNRLVTVAATVFFIYGLTRMALVNDYRSPRERILVQTAWQAVQPKPDAAPPK
ncbi:MAG: DUF2752 domain-containing protein [Fimbriimonadaceae bacterium]|nr:DUF2752 domain-containing protein [Fimbriimonadaceae bacterium]